MKSKTYIKSGDVINRFTVISFSHKDKHNRSHFLCKCLCGKEKTVQGSLLTSGNTKSCGCFAKEVRKTKVLPNNKGVITQILLGYKRHARDRNLVFDLSYEDFASLIIQPCYYCGCGLSNIKITKNYKQGFPYNGIDRIDSAVGYNITNVVPCCKMCNLSKKDLSKEEFLSWIERVYLFNKQ
jgi:hypothetical protein